MKLHPGVGVIAAAVRLLARAAARPMRLRKSRMAKGVAVLRISSLRKFTGYRQPRGMISGRLRLNAEKASSNER